MSEQDGIQPPTKQRRSRKINIANQQENGKASAAQRPVIEDRKAWKAYWQAQGQPWRTEPEIKMPYRILCNDVQREGVKPSPDLAFGVSCYVPLHKIRYGVEINEERQKYLAERRCITPDIEQGIYPFKGIKLSRADVEWLLATHEEKTWQTGINITIRSGIDLRGADLRRIDLQRLPLTGLVGGLLPEEWFNATADQREEAAIHLEEANLTMTDLTQSQLKSAHLEGANLSNTHFEFASLRGAHLGGETITEECRGMYQNRFSERTSSLKNTIYELPVYVL